MFVCVYFYVEKIKLPRLEVFNYEIVFFWSIYFNSMNNAKEEANNVRHHLSDSVVSHLTVLLTTGQLEPCKGRILAVHVCPNH